MALFQKKPQVQSSAPLYTLGANKTVLIIGLGNPGAEYKDARHNIGFKVLDEFAAKNDFPGWIAKKDLKCQLSIQSLGQSRVILCKPATFMNNSGEAAQAVQRFYRVYNQTTLAVYDELAVPFGSLRTRLGGSDAGHNGVKSLTQHLGDDYGRLRVGVGSDISAKADAADFVLGKFTKKEQENLPVIIKEACAITTEFIFDGSLPHETRAIL
ncbi:MAG TPA: aminoacyl-tRNA hydrolase [Candidatus Saccharimonadales bacterium]|nr:aminoacyl-tRNA hydrolase [Candidatus Saccharimonadales bacterium]